MIKIIYLKSYARLPTTFVPMWDFSCVRENVHVFLGKLPDLQINKLPLVRYERGAQKIRDKPLNSFW